MPLNCGIVGLPMVGKTTIFNLLTGTGAETSNFYSGKTGSNRGIAKIPDPRINFLSSVYKPRKTVYAELEVVDVPGLVRGASEGQGSGNAFLDGVRNTDALLHVVRAFANSEVLHVDGSIDPLRDIETVNLELLLADLELVEKRLERIKSGKKIKAEQQRELAFLERLRTALEAEQPVHSLDLDPEDQALVKNIGFLTDKPMLLVVNLDEEQAAAGDYPGREQLRAETEKKGISLLEISAGIEAEIAELPEEEREEFMTDLGILEPGIARLARAIYDLLGLISFFTVGEDEVKAWTIKKGTTARKAAGKIHSDIERGFIRAETVRYDDFAAQGSMARVKEKGLFRLEGKEYVVEDGDIINFRFNV